jgi:hypothetical protein
MQSAAILEPQALATFLKASQGSSFSRELEWQRLVSLEMALRAGNSPRFRDDLDLRNVRFPPIQRKQPGERAQPGQFPPWGLVCSVASTISLIFPSCRGGLAPSPRSCRWLAKPWGPATHSELHTAISAFIARSDRLTEWLFHGGNKAQILSLGFSLTQS